MAGNVIESLGLLVLVLYGAWILGSQFDFLVIA